MSIVSKDLDATVREEIRSAMIEELYYRLKTLPLYHEVDKIKSVIQGEFKIKLDNIIKSYYRDFIEHDVVLNISEDDYVKIYLNIA